MRSCSKLTTQERFQVKSHTVRPSRLYLEASISKSDTLSLLTQNLGWHSGFLASRKVNGSLELALSTFNFLRWFSRKARHSY